MIIVDPCVERILIWCFGIFLPKVCLLECWVILWGAMQDRITTAGNYASILGAAVQRLFSFCIVSDNT